MLRAGIPTRLQLPFANNAGGSYIRSVPIPSQIGIQDGAASYTDGFPPLSMTPIAGGGKWPFGQDFNGVLLALSSWARWQAAAGPVAYDATFATSSYVGGYPAGAVITAATLGSFWLNLVDNNTSNPDTGGANWVGYTPVNLYAADSGTANAGVATLSPAPLSLTALIGYPVRIKKASSNNSGAYTLNLNGFGAKSVIHSDSSTLASGELPASGIFTVVYDGTNFQLQSTAQAVGVTPAQLQIQAGNYGTDTGNANNAIVTLAPVPISLASITGSSIRIKKMGQGNTGGAYTLTLNGFALKDVVHADGTPLFVSELPPSCMFEVTYDGTRFILLNMPGIRAFGSTTIAAASGGSGLTLTPADFAKTLYFINVGTGAVNVVLPDATVVGSGWFVRLRCQTTASGDYGTITPAGGQTLDSRPARVFGQDTDVTIVSDGANFGTVSGSYVRYSAPTNIAASTVYAFNHGLLPIGGASSVRTELYWNCITTDNGYAVGDVLEGKLSVVNQVAATNTISISQDASGATTRVMTAVNLVAPHKTTTNAANLTYANWQLCMRCETL